MASLCLPDVSCFLGRRDFTFPVDLAGVRLAGVGDAGVGDAGIAEAGVADSGVEDCEDISATWLYLPVICGYLSTIERII